MKVYKRDRSTQNAYILTQYFPYFSHGKKIVKETGTELAKCQCAEVKFKWLKQYAVKGQHQRVEPELSLYAYPGVNGQDEPIPTL